jgi:hypothetical protein
LILVESLPELDESGMGTRSDARHQLVRQRSLATPREPRRQSFVRDDLHPNVARLDGTAVTGFREHAALA